MGERSRPAVLGLAWMLAVGLAAVGLVATLQLPEVPSVPAGTPDELAAFRPDVLGRVADFVDPLRAWFPVRTALALGAPLLLVVTRTGRRVVRRLSGRRLVQLRAAAVVVGAGALVDLPFAFTLGHVHATEQGLRTGSAARFVVEWSLATLLVVGLTAGAVAVLLRVVRRLPRGWPPAVVLLATVAAVGMVVLEPVVTTRLRYDPVPLTDPTVRAALEPVLAASDLDDPQLVVGAASVRTTRVNAYATGAGATATIVLWDTLLEQRDLDEVVAVVAHEVAHAERADPLRGVLAVATGTLPLVLLGSWLLRRRPGLPLSGAVPAAVLALVVVVAELPAGMLVDAQSRRVEAAADARARELGADPAAQVRLVRGFVVDGLSDPSPPTWVRLVSGSHPTPRERILAAVAQARAADVALPSVAELRALEDDDEDVQEDGDVEDQT